MIKKLSLISLFTLLPASFYFAQTTVYAYVKDAAGKPIENAEIDLAQSGNDVTADKIGYFQFVDMQPGRYLITIFKPTFEPKIVEFDVTADEKRKDLGVISLNPSPTDAGVLVIDDSAGDNDEGGSSMQPTIGLLSSGRDVFQSVTAFELGAYWFRPRGIENRYEDILFNGVSMSKNDDGRVDFSNWGGLNDVTRYPFENVDNITPSEYTFGNLGGVVYYNTRASSYRKQTSLAYSFTNRSYFHRAMATYSSGLTKNGWAFTFSGSRRWADDGVIDGTYQDSYAYFAAIEKQFSSRHAINFTAFGAPTYRASNSPNTQETYDLMGKNYNAYWGWQDGEKRNSRIRRVFEPVFMLTDYLKIGENSNWNNTISYQFGRDGRSRLDWFHAADPNPTYYRKLPGYMYSGFMDADSDGSTDITDAEQAQFNAYVNQWQTNPNVSQIDWNSLYSANILNRYDMNGNEQGAVYTIVEDVNKDKTLNFASHFDTKLASNWKLNLNFNYQNLKSDNFREMKDLLGALYANDLNAFNNDAPNDADNPGRRIMEGDRTQYSYDLLRNTYALNASTEVDFPKWNVMASVFSSYSESQREGKFRNPLYADSKGKSDIYDAFDAGIKGRVTYKIDGRNFIVYNGALFSLAPTLNEIFINPRATNLITPGVENQIVNSNDLSYILRGQILKLRLGAYHTTMNNATEISRYYVDISSETADQGNALVAEVLSGINKTYKGLELGAEVKITPTLSANAVASYGDYRITNNPTVYTTDDDSVERTGSPVREWGTAQLKDYKVAGTPQKAYSFGLRYNSTKFWWLGASANYLQDQFLDFSALNKTAALYTNPLTGDNYNGVTPEQIARLTAQQKFEDQFMLNANAGKTFVYGKYRMGVSVSVNNILNNRDYVTGGFEQGRNVNFPESLADANRTYSYFGPKLWYDRGRTFFANVYLRF
ncbi:TonB-dependent receptor [Marnyiella aurantia]|uniref:TonB-dependent receptor n=1 Tax=Marnyiella aurantia TaxID=2758037 RepID=A0A7D7LNY4_9FLAO|nr:TonB-dependent receptor [Marnyiella aurantia]MBA5246943.1 TonB-dependent receptor [Marnyiella aurantia]MBP0611978.1 TonB-dependent receptor [Marnyiella aurantia]QMS97716.1 TonB-dependent receptor [Marnyiella aurantia]